METKNKSKNYGNIPPKNGIITTSDFFEKMQKNPKATVYSRINSLLKRGMIQKIGRGKYKYGKTNEFELPIEQRMIFVYQLITDMFPYLKLCVWNLSVINLFSNNLINYNLLIIDVEKDAVDAVFFALKEKGYSVVTRDRMYDDLSEFNGYLFIRPLVTSAPLKLKDGIIIPKIEKLLIDIAFDKEFIAFQKSEIFNIYKEVFSNSTINESSLLRYASRKGKRVQTEELLKAIK